MERFNDALVDEKREWLQGAVFHIDNGQYVFDVLAVIKTEQGGYPAAVQKGAVQYQMLRKMTTYRLQVRALFGSAADGVHIFPVCCIEEIPCLIRVFIRARKALFERFTD